MAGSISATTATLIAGGASSALTGVSKYEQGQKQQQAYDYNASVTLKNTSNQVVANQQKFSERIGRQATAYAGAGVDITSGSPLLIMAATAARGGEQGEMIEESGEQEANLQRYYGKMAAFSGTTSGIGSFLSGMTQDVSAYEKLKSNPKPSATGMGEGIEG